MRRIPCRGHSITLLGTGLVAEFYAMTLHRQRGRDRIRVVFSRSEERGAAFRERWAIPEATIDLEAAVNHPDTDVVIIALPNFLHEKAVALAAKAGKAILCTKPLGRTSEEARRMLEAVEATGVFAGGMDLRDEVAGSEGMIWLDHFLRTGFEMFTAGGSGGYVAEKAETASGRLFPVGDEVVELGYVDMFADMLVHRSDRLQRVGAFRLS